MKTKCTACGQIFDSRECGDSPDFDNHDCPATPAPLKGESWDDYKIRAEKLKEKFQNEN